MLAYAITDPTHLWSGNERYFQNLNRADWILYRDKGCNKYQLRAKEFYSLFLEGRPKILLHQDFTLASALGAWGVHLTSKQFNAIKDAKQLGLFTIISTHTFNEIALAEELGADAVTFSPIFKTPNKGEPKGIAQLKEAILQFKIDIIALGGIISKEQIEEVKRVGAYGFASIRYFVK